MASKILRPLHMVCVNHVDTPNYSLIQIRRNNATAYNGSVMVKINLKEASGFSEDEIDILNGKFVHMEVWREMIDCEEFEILENQIIVHTDGIKKTLYYNDPVGDFFDMDDLLVDIKHAGEEKKRIMTYNTKHIALVQKVMGHDQLHFSFTKGGKGTIVFPHEDCGMFAVLAPIPNLEDAPINRYLFID